MRIQYVTKQTKDFKGRLKSLIINTHYRYPFCRSLLFSSRHNPCTTQHHSDIGQYDLMHLSAPCILTFNSSSPEIKLQNKKFSHSLIHHLPWGTFHRDHYNVSSTHRNAENSFVQPFIIETWTASSIYYY